MIASQAMRFAAVGVVGFFVDAATLMLAILFLGLNVYWGRAVSYVVAATATWAMNRKFTFRQHASPALAGSMFKEWIRFCAANSVGGLVNVGTYIGLLNAFTLVRQFPVLGVAAGSLSGMLVNFTLSRRFVFRGSPPRVGDITR
jgi:putative flippase GtrA